MAKRISNPKSEAKRTDREALALIRLRAQSLQKEANERAAKLEMEGLQGYSKAYSDALDKRGGYRTSEKLFDVDDTQRFREVKREIALIEKFLEDDTSTVEGARDFKINSKWGGAFRGDWYKQYGVSYDKSRIDEELAKIAFAMYRRIEEDKASYEKIVGMAGYGSENLIMAIYDMVVEENWGSQESMSYWEKYGDVLENARRMVDESYAKKSEDADYMKDAGNVDTDPLFEIAAHSVRAEDVLNKLNF